MIMLFLKIFLRRQQFCYVKSTGKVVKKKKKKPWKDEKEKGQVGVGEWMTKRKEDI